MALMSGKVYSNTGAPSNADGIDGDIYMQLDGFKTTYRKESGAWVAVGSTLGAIPEFISGVGVPSNVLGDDGQYYRNSANQDMYYKQGGLWANVGNLAGAASIPLLEQAGIGKDLGTAPNLVTAGSMNDLTAVGEYYVSGVTETPVGVNAGFLKVWRIDANNVGQILQRVVGSSLTELHFRISTGGVFGNWQTYALPNGDATKFFSVAEAILDEHAVNKLQTGNMIQNALTFTLNPKALGRALNIAGGLVQYYTVYNVGTITRIANGWQVFFNNNLPNTDYVVVGSVTGGGGYGGRSFESYDHAVGSFKIQSSWGGDNTAGSSTGDGAQVNFVVY